MSFFRRNKKQELPRRRQIVEANILRAEGEKSASQSKQYGYRSGRTITGSTSSNVSTVNEPGAELRSPRVHGHLLRRKRRHLSLVLFAVLIVCGLLYFLINQLIATPSARLVKNGVYISSSEFDGSKYESAINDYLSEHFLERFAFSLNRESLNKNIQSRYPEIDAIVLDHLDGFGKVNFKIVPRIPIAVWNIGNDKLFVDSKGVAFTKSYYDDPAVTIIDESGLPSDGKTVASNRFLSFIGKVVGYTASQGYTVNKISLPRYTTRQIEASLDKVDYPIRMTFDRPAGEQVEDMLRVIKFTNNKQMSIEYADVRVSGRAYYKDK